MHTRDGLEPRNILFMHLPINSYKLRNLISLNCEYLMFMICYWHGTTSLMPMIRGHALVPNWNVQVYRHLLTHGTTSLMPMIGGHALVPNWNVQVYRHLLTHGQRVLLVMSLKLFKLSFPPLFMIYRENNSDTPIVLALTLILRDWYWQKVDLRQEIIVWHMYMI